MRVNEFKQPIGEALDDFVTPSFPDAQTLEGSYGRLTKLSIEHINDLYDVLCDVESRRIWTYLYEALLILRPNLNNTLNNLLIVKINISLRF